MKKKILRYSDLDESFEDIKPAKTFIPDWYKGAKGYNANNLVFSNENAPMLNFKACFPFFDSLTSGYMITLSSDLHFELLDNGSHYLRWGKTSFQPADLRNANLNREIPIPSGYSEEHFVWRLHNIFKAPVGYSLLITHPFNRFDLPFITLSAVVDADQMMNAGNVPFFIKKDFNGIIESGTPIAQVIPVKRESWKIERDDSLREEGVIRNKKNSKKFLGYYKNNLWQRKSFE
jgi:hypothetical protein